MAKTSYKSLAHFQNAELIQGKNKLKICKNHDCWIL